MAMDKPRASGMESKERIPAAIRSVAFTLIAWTAAAGLVAMIGLGALAGCAGDQGEDQNLTGESQTGHDGTENARTEPEGMEKSGTEHDGAENAGAGPDDGEAEHDGAENAKSGPDDGEESGESLALDETYDFVRKGARLILRYDTESNSFAGTVQNTTGELLDNIRVEVHLSNGTELGPTSSVDLAPDETVDVSLAATEEPFTGWTPHAEVGEGEHGGGEGGGEHGSSEESRVGEHGEGGEGGGEHGDGEGDEGSGEHGSGG